MDDQNTPLRPSPPPLVTQSIVSREPQVTVPTPTREPSFRKGAYTGNILRLEQSAEKMSEGGSDIGEEIRKMNELEKQRSRQNSIQSSHQGDVTPGRSAPMAPLDTTRSRASSHAQSVTDANNVARWGGYSPSAYITSPVGSVRSHNSWNMNRKPSVSSKLSHMVEPIQEGRPLDSPLAPSLRSPLSNPSMSRQVSHASVSSFGAKYDMISAQIQEQLDDVPPTPPRNGDFADLDFTEGGAQDWGHQRDGTATPPARPRSSDTFQEIELAFKDFDGVHYRPETDEIVEVDENGNEVRRVSARTVSTQASSMLRAPEGRPDSFAMMPPPAENSTYYPAPVPRMLNLPKRLSQLPSATVHAKRRTQIISELSPGARQSAPWLSQTDLGYGGERRSGSGSQPGDHPRPALNQRMSMANMQSLPPQLLASVFFEQQGIQQDVQIQNRSAVATLEDILNASATAPVNAFIDHPFAGDVRKTNYAAERPNNRHSTATLIAQASNPEPESKEMKRRTTSLGGLLKRASSGDQLGDALKKRGSRSSISMLDFAGNGKKLQKRNSRASVLDMQQEEDDTNAKTPATEIDLSGGMEARAGDESPMDERRPADHSRPATAMSGGKMMTENEQIEADFRERAADEDAGDIEEEEHEASFVQPATLLAELQVRKAQLKSRSRTAAMAYPQGMHSTLLQIDAVEEINTRKRRQQRVALAWEDPALREQEGEKGDGDDDVPLGVLYPSKNGLINQKLGDTRDWDRPLGLMEKRELENNETLSSRRNRLRGGPALPRNLGPSSGRAPVPLDSRNSQFNLVVEPEVPANAEAAKEGEDEEEGETLGQRLKKLRTKNVLDTAIGNLDTPPKDGERPNSTWSVDILSQFGGLDAAADKKDPSDPNAAPSPPVQPTPLTQEELENETLGQRRARLQREREAADAAGIAPEASASPAVRPSRSMADLLASNPVGGGKRVTKDHQPARGTLLYASEQEKTKNRRGILQSNMRSVSQANMPTDQRRAMAPRAVSGFPMPQQQQSPNMMQAGFGAYNNGLPTTNSTPMFTGANSYFPSPTAAMQQQNQGMQMQMPGFSPQQQMQQMQMQMQANQAYAQQMGYAMPMNMPMNMNMAMPPMTPMGMPMAAGGYEEGISPQQRDNIDRWRMSVAPQQQQ